LTYDYNVWEGSFPISSQYFPWNDPFDFTENVTDVVVDTMNIRVLVSYDDDPVTNSSDDCRNRIYLEVWFTDSSGSAQTCLTGDGSFGSAGNEPSSTAYGAGQCYMWWIYNGAQYDGLGGLDGYLARGVCTDCRKMHFSEWNSSPVGSSTVFYNGSTDPRLTPATTGTNCILANFDFFEVPGDFYPDRKWIPEAIVSTNTTTIDCCDPCTDATTKTISTGTLAPASWTEIDEWVLDQDGDCTWSAEFDITDCTQTVGFGSHTIGTMKMTYSVEDSGNPFGTDGTMARIYVVLYDTGGVPVQMTVYSPTDETDPDTDLDGSLICTPYTGGALGYPDSDGCPNANGTATVPGVPMFIGYNPTWGSGSSDECYSQIGGWAYVKA
tara:strand:- start:10876 stop:12018 length:1143 start_codon:yes stop_codon:yes gene_type:complete